MKVKFFDTLLAPWQVLLDDLQESYLWMFTCGSLINKVKSFNIYSSQFFGGYIYYNSFALMLSYCCSHKFTGCVTFNALQFQPSFTSHLLLAFADIVLIVLQL